MSAQQLLKFIAGDEPIFNLDYAILSAPVRHIFMMATVWYLCREKTRENMKILEIGSWVGASALSWAQGLKLHNRSKGMITCVDAWQPFFDHEIHKSSGHYVMQNALGLDTAYQVFLHNINTTSDSILCQHLRGNSENILPLLRENTFDVVFIDANHAYIPVLKDIHNSLSLVKEGGIICGDDLNLQLHQVDKDHALLHAKADDVKDPKSGKVYHPGVSLAVAEVFGEVSVWGGFWAMQKKGDRWQKISLKGMPIHYPDHFPKTALKKAEDHLNDIEIT